MAFGDYYYYERFGEIPVSISLLLRLRHTYVIFSIQRTMQDMFYVQKSNHVNAFCTIVRYMWKIISATFDEAGADYMKNPSAFQVDGFI